MPIIDGATAKLQLRIVMAGGEVHQQEHAIRLFAS
jgi:hypothetical protein